MLPALLGFILTPSLLIADPDPFDVERHEVFFYGFFCHLVVLVEFEKYTDRIKYKYQLMATPSVTVFLLHL